MKTFPAADKDRFTTTVLRGKDYMPAWEGTAEAGRRGSVVGLCAVDWKDEELIARRLDTLLRAISLAQFLNSRYLSTYFGEEAPYDKDIRQDSRDLGCGVLLFNRVGGSLF